MGIRPRRRVVMSQSVSIGRAHVVVLPDFPEGTVRSVAPVGGRGEHVPAAANCGNCCASPVERFGMNNSKHHADSASAREENGEGRGAGAKALTSLAVVILVIGTVLDRVADLDMVYVITRLVALPVLVAALVVGVRARAGLFTILLPGALLALVVATFFVR